MADLKTRILKHVKNYRRPSLKAVSTFEAAARHQSFKVAAKELHLTPSAISHQVRQLEEHLGVKLFHRISSGLAITDAGSAYLSMLGPAFAEIDHATRQVMQLEYADQLRLRSAPSFAKKWLLDRLPDFLKQYPDTDVKLIATSEQLDFRSSQIDIGIYYGNSSWTDGYIVRPLLSERVLPMCSAQMEGYTGVLRAPQQLVDFTLIHTERNLTSWNMWLADKDVGLSTQMRSISIDPSELAIEAAVRGVGIVLESDLLAGEELARGSLVPAIKDSVSETISYYLVYPEDHAKIPKVIAFSNWIMSLANSSRSDTAS